jgi:hypothetical protein
MSCKCTWRWQVLTVMLAAVTMALSLAPAIEFSGKLRLKKERYLAVQPIYYPGFTIGGIAEPAVILATLALLIVTPAGTAAFWLVAGALAALVTVQVIFWSKTQPVNCFWLEEASLTARRPASSRPAGEALHATGRPRVISGSARTYGARWPQLWACSC